MFSTIIFSEHVFVRTFQNNDKLYKIFWLMLEKFNKIQEKTLKELDMLKKIISLIVIPGWWQTSHKRCIEFRTSK